MGCHVRDPVLLGSGYWRVRWTDEAGKWHDRKVRTEAEAKRFADALRAKFDGIAEPQRAVDVPGKVPRIADPRSVNEWLAALAAWANLVAERPYDAEVARSANTMRGVALAAERFIPIGEMEAKIADLEKWHQDTMRARVYADPIASTPIEGVGDTAH